MEKVTISVANNSYGITQETLVTRGAIWSQTKRYIVRHRGRCLYNGDEAVETLTCGIRQWSGNVSAGYAYHCTLSTVSGMEKYPRAEYGADWDRLAEEVLGPLPPDVILPSVTLPYPPWSWECGCGGWSPSNTVLLEDGIQQMIEFRNTLDAAIEAAKKQKEIVNA